MTTSELIDVLKQIKKEHGDVEVVFEGKSIDDYTLVEYLDEVYVELMRK